MVVLGVLGVLRGTKKEVLRRKRGRV